MVVVIITISSSIRKRGKTGLRKSWGVGPTLHESITEAWFGILSPQFTLSNTLHCASTLYHFIFVFLKAHHNNTKLKRRVFLINRGTATGVSDVLAVLNSRSRSKKGKFQKKKTQIIKW